MLPEWFKKVIFPIEKFIEMQVNLVWVGIFKNNFNDSESTQLVYNEHIVKVKKTIPHDRLLIYNVHEGWVPLCEFLNVDVPDNIPFPHVNDTAEMLRNFSIIKALPYLLILSITALSIILFMSVL